MLGSASGPACRPRSTACAARAWPHGGLVDDRGRRVLVVDDDQRPGPAACARRTASASGTFAGIGMACRASRRALTRQPLTDLRRPDRLGRRDPHEPAMTSSQSQFRLRDAAAALLTEQGHADQRDGQTRPAQAAAIVPVTGLPVIFHTAGAQHPAAVQRQAGSRLKIPTTGSPGTAGRSGSRNAARPNAILASRSRARRSPARAAGPAPEIRASRPGSAAPARFPSSRRADTAARAAPAGRRPGPRRSARARAQHGT